MPCGCSGHASACGGRLKVVAQNAAAVPVVSGAHRALIAVGMCLAAVTVANLALVWGQVEFGSAQWELAAATQTFERVPMLLLSLLLVGLGGSAHAPAAARGAAVGLWVVGVVVLGLDVLYALAALEAFNTLPAAAQSAFKASAVKNVIASGAFVLTAGYVGWVFWGRRERGHT